MAAEATAKPPSKSEVLGNIAQATELSRKQVASVFDALANEMKKSLGKKGPGIFVVPGLMKIKVRMKPAKKAGMRMDPFTKQERMFKAKPASRGVKVLALKSLKEMVK